MSFRSARTMAIVLSAIAMLALVGAVTGCGHTIYGRNTGGVRFDFRSPPCFPEERASPGPEGVIVRYLGVAGVSIEWGGEVVMTAPFFSNPGMARIPLGRYPSRPDRVAAAFKRTKVPVERVGAILVGHAHYDHLGDVPTVGREHAQRARVYVNATGAASLAAEPELDGRVETVEPGGKWIPLRDAKGTLLPVRALPIRSLHAPHFGRYTWGSGERRDRAHRPLSEQRIHSMRAGTTLAYVIDLLDAQGETRFRAYFQDSVNDGDWGYPPDLGDDHGFDLAILVMASYHLVTDAPKRIIATLQPRHVLVTHFESFFRDPERPTVFVPGLTNRRANRFLDRVREATDGYSGHRGPKEPVCGPSSTSWTMPVVGESLVFDSSGG